MIPVAAVDGGMRFRAHGHLWALWDGTPAHAPPGRLTYDDEGRIACHLCGRWFVNLGSHLRKHGWDAARYRDAVGLRRHDALCSRSLSGRIAERQRGRYATDVAMRTHLDVGARMARGGELTEAAVRGAEKRRGAEHPEALARRDRALTAGRETRRRRSEQRLAELLRATGVSTLPDLLRREYDAGASVDSLRAMTGLGRARLRAELAIAGIAVRATGTNTPASRARRARDIDDQVCQRLGVEDIGCWLREQRASGVPLATLALRTGRSTAWVRARLEARTTTARTG